MKPVPIFCFFTFVAILGCHGSDQADKGTGTASAEFAPVQSVLTANCVKCHSGDRAKAGIDMSSYATLLKGGRMGPVIVAGKPADSILLQALRGQNGKRQMPPGTPLDEAKIKTIETWVQNGAKS